MTTPGKQNPETPPPSAPAPTDKQTGKWLVKRNEMDHWTVCDSSGWFLVLPSRIQCEAVAHAHNTSLLPVKEEELCMCLMCQQYRKEKGFAETPVASKAGDGQTQKFGHWIAVADQLPTGEEVLYWDGQCISTFFPATGTEPINQARERCESFGITHWMPFPDSPSVPNGNAEHPALPVNPSPIPQQERIEELEDLLTSAHAIATRKGADTAWERFSERLTKAGIGSVTARVFKRLPDNAENFIKEHNNG